jgi:ATP-dependent RNA helicase DDX51/DBP6
MSSGNNSYIDPISMYLQKNDSGYNNNKRGRQQYENYNNNNNNNYGDNSHQNNNYNDSNNYDNNNNGYDSKRRRNDYYEKTEKYVPEYKKDYDDDGVDYTDYVNDNNYNNDYNAYDYGAETTEQMDDFNQINEQVQHGNDVKKDNIWVMSSATLPLSQTALHPNIIDILSTKMKITDLFAVQRAVVPVAIAMTESQTPGDICICSPTGSGKTLSYVLPILHSCLNLRLCKLRAVVLVPNKMLSKQVYDVFAQFSTKLNIKVEQCDGTYSFEQEQKKIIGKVGEDFCSLTNIIISTPSRLMRHMRDTKGFLKLMTCLKYIVLDEVDAMMDASSRNDMLRTLLTRYEETLQAQTDNQMDVHVPLPVPYTVARKILCSATLTPHAGRLSKLNLHRPQFFTNILKHTPLGEEIKDIAIDLMEDKKQSTNIIEDDQTTKHQKYSTPDMLQQFIVPYDTSLKPLYLVGILLHPNLQIFTKQRKVVCFCDTTENAHRLDMMINSFISTGAWENFIKINEQIVKEKKNEEVDVYQNMATPDPSRNYHISEVYDPKKTHYELQALLKRFSRSKFSILFCTDALGRGMNLEADTVINYDTPSYLKTYMHRIGRTARAGGKGTAITLCQKDNVDLLKTKLTTRISMNVPVSQYLVSMRAINQMIEPYKAVVEDFRKKMNKK